MKQLFLFLTSVVTIGLLACGGGGGGGDDDDDDGGGSVTLSGRLSIGTSNDASAPALVSAQTAAAGHIVQVNNITEGTVAYVTTDSEGDFNFNADPNDDLIVRFLDDNYKTEGILVADSDDSTATVGLNGPASDFNLGSVVLNTGTGVATSSDQASGVAAQADDTYGCDATDGVPDKGLLGRGTDGIDDNHDNTADGDGDCIPDVGDVDDDNDALLDDQDGEDAFEECPGVDQVVLFMNNKINVPEVNDQATGQAIVITQHVAAEDGKTIDSVTVAGPSYLDNVVVQESSFYDTAIANGTAWDKQLVPCQADSDPNHCIFVAAGGGLDLGTAMAAGDTFVYTVRFTDGTSSTCTRMINSVLTYTPYAIKIGDDEAAVGALTPVTNNNFINVAAFDGDGDGRLRFAYSIPAGTQLGFTPQIEPAPLDAGCAQQEFSFLPMADLDTDFTGDTRTAATDGQADVVVDFDIIDDEDWPDSAGGAWRIDIAFRSMIGDNAAATSIGLRTAASACTDGP